MSELSKPYNLNRPEHLIVNEVKRRIEGHLWEGGKGIGVKFESMPEIEQLIQQYNTELTKMWDANAELDFDNQRLRVFRQLAPAEFAALSLARDLPNSGIHDESFRTPGQVTLRVIKLLLERRLIEAAPNPGYYSLSEMGKRLMGKLEEDEPEAADK